MIKSIIVWALTWLEVSVLVIVWRHAHWSVALTMTAYFVRRIITAINEALFIHRTKEVPPRST